MLDQDFDKLLEVFLAVPHCYLVSLGRSNLDDARNFQKIVEMLAKLENLFAGFGHPKHQRQPPFLVDQDYGHDLGHAIGAHAEHGVRNDHGEHGNRDYHAPVNYDFGPSGG